MGLFEKSDRRPVSIGWGSATINQPTTFQPKVLSTAKPPQVDALSRTSTEIGRRYGVHRSDLDVCPSVSLSNGFPPNSPLGVHSTRVVQAWKEQKEWFFWFARPIVGFIRIKPMFECRVHFLTALSINRDWLVGAAVDGRPLGRHPR